MQVIIRTLTWTLIHSLWQGLLCALLAALVISSTRTSTARLRYNLLGIIMLLFFAASVVTFFIQWHVEVKVVGTPSFSLTEAQVINNTTGLIDNFIAWINSNSNIVILAWAFFFLFNCLRFITGLAAINRLRHYKAYPVSREWKDKLTQLQLVTGVRQSVCLLQSELVKVPMALGVLKPVIFLPLGLLTHLPAQQIETILIHELAHIRRRDYLVNLLQHMAESIFFFNPALRWLSSLIRQEREACCDDIVVASCSQKTNYLNALINFQEYSLHHSSYALGISGKPEYLLNRVKRMITKRNKGINIFEKVGLLAGVLFFSAFTFVTKQNNINTGVTIMQQPVNRVLPIIDTIPEPRKEKKEEKKVNNPKTPVIDTFPAKKVKLSDENKSSIKKPLPTLKEHKQVTTEAEAKLQEIIEIKNQIGLKKESIGDKKEQLNTKNDQDKVRILKEIELERHEIETKRSELKIKRVQWENLKKEEIRKVEKKVNTDAKVSTQIEKKATIEINKDANLAIKSKPVIVDEKKVNFKIANPKVDKQEFLYKMNLQQKISPPIKPNPPLGKFKPRRPPVIKIPQ